MKKIISLLVCAVAAITLNATDYTIETIPTPATPVLSAVIPLVAQTSSASSVTQQVFLASELSELGASTGNITGIKFYYGGKSNTTAVPSVTRNLKIYMQETTADSLILYEIPGAYITNYRFKFVGAGTLVYDGAITTEEISAGEVKTLSIPFNQGSLSWSGSKNIILTVFDVTNTAYSSTEANLRFELKATPHARFAHQYWTASGDHDASDYLSTLAGLESYSYTSGTGTAQQKQVKGHLYVPKTTFTITPSPAPSVPATPSDLHVEATLWNAATLDWSTVEGATSYDMQQSADGETWSTLEEGIDETSFLWEGLAEASTQYARIRASNANGSSEWSDAITVTTDAKHIHDGITFDKWNNPSVLPKQGNFYLKDDVEYDPLDPTTITLTGNLNLCLNGHEANLYGTKIVVPDGKTLTIYDNVGGGKITGFVQSVIGGSETYSTALIVIYSGGTLVLKQGTIENTYTPDVDGESYAIYSNGTVRISGDVLIDSNSADIYLYASNIITLDGAISNTEKHTVWKNGGVFTSGWPTYMSGEDPRDFFESANPAKSVCLNEGEAALRSVINIRDNADNTSTIHTNDGLTLDVSLTRTWAADGYYSTLCLPFDLSSAQVSSIFGAGTELATLSSSSIDEETIYLVFESASSIEAGKPYLINPVNDVVNPQIAGVTIAEDLHDITTTYVDFKGIFSPTALAASENILCLGGSNSLGWPSAAGNLNGMRAYFEIHSLPAGAPALRHARFVAPGQHIPAAIDDAQDQEGRIEKVIEDGQVIIIRDGKKYNILGINK